MRFYSGKTPCQVCGRPLDLTDDWIPIPLWDATAQVVPGFYHRTCFDRHPWRSEAVIRWRRYNEAQIQSRAASTEVVGQTNRYLLIYGTADRALELFYLDHMARQRFRDPDEWTGFVQFVRDVAEDESFRDNQEGEFESQSRQFSARIVPPDRVVLGWGVAVRREMDFPREEYDAYVAQHGPLQGFVEFPELVEAGLLHPTMVDGELAKNRGVVVEVKPVKDVYVVVFDAPRIVRLELSREQFTDLAQFLAGLKLGF
jgi:hypothetical protein